MMLPTRPLSAADSAALDTMLATWALPGAYARSHLRARGLGEGGVTAVACASPEAPSANALDAVLVGDDGIGWALWQQPAQAAALAAALPALALTLLSGPRPLVAPLLAHLATVDIGGVDRCPFERLAPAGLRAPVAEPSLAPRRATLADLEPLIDFYIRGFYSLAQYPTRSAWRARLTDQLTHRSLYLIEQDGVVVSAALSSAETPAVAMIGGVATVPAYRNRGLSAHCVHALCTALFAAGIGEIGLFYLPANAPAARVYAKLGFQPAGEWWLQRLNYW